VATLGLVIDAHHHFWDPAAADYSWIAGAYSPLRRRYGPEHLGPEIRSAGVSGTIVVEALPHLDETYRLLEVVHKVEWVTGVVGWVDLTAPDVADTIGMLLSASGGEYLVGIRHPVHDEPDPNWLLKSEVLRGLQAVSDAGLVYDLLVRTRELPAALEVGRRLPHLRLVVDHLAKPPIATGETEPWRSLLSGFRSLENVACKVSGMVTEADWVNWRPTDLEPYIGTALDIFGPKRLMFGSDWPVCLLASDYRQVFDTTVGVLSALIGDDLIDVFGGCALRTYGLLGQ
jgi:predicted TIM-barrel fold metal-dependent hydrolase